MQALNAPVASKWSRGSVLGATAVGTAATALGLSAAVAFADAPAVVAKKGPVSKSEGSGAGELKLFSGRANIELAPEIADTMKVQLGKISIKGFEDGEIGIQVM